LVNFLLRKKELTHAAIDDAALSTAGNFRGMPKQVLSLREFDTQNRKLLHQSTADSTNLANIKLTPDTGASSLVMAVPTYADLWGMALSFSGAERKVRSLMMLPA